MLDPILHQPVRTRLVAWLSSHGECTFTEMKELLEVTDGNLEAHLKKLIHEKYIDKRRETGLGRPQTYYRLNEYGHERFKEYVFQLQLLLNSNDN